MEDRRHGLAEEVRVLYVALTRARERLVLLAREGSGSPPWIEALSPWGYDADAPPEDGETIAEAAVREMREETGVDVGLEDLERVGHLTFLFPYRPDWEQVVHVYLARQWQGTPQETDEMVPAFTEPDARGNRHLGFF